MTARQRKRPAAAAGDMTAADRSASALVRRPVQAVVRVRLAPATSRQAFEQHLRTLACVLCAWQVAGEVDYELRVACSDIADLDAMLTDLRRGGAEGTSTGLVLRGVPGLSEADLFRPASDQPLAVSA